MSCNILFIYFSFLGKAGVKGTEALSHHRDVPESSSHCLPCQEGCDFCKDNTPCVARGDSALRMAVLSFQGLCMLLDFISMVLLYHFRRNKVSVCCRRELIKMATVSMKHILFLLTLGVFPCWVTLQLVTRTLSVQYLAC